MLNMLQQQPLGARGWAYQERILSQRVLNFTSRGTLWNCSQSQALEDGSIKPCEGQITSFSNADPPTDLGLRDFTSSRHWSQIVLEYTRLSLTDPTDKLPALSGIVAKLQRLTKDDYYAGLWKKRFMEGLLWTTWMVVPTDAHSQARQVASTPWIAPSWSFAAFDGWVYYDPYIIGSLYLPYESLGAKLEYCNLTPLDVNNPLGKLKSGFTRVKGSVTTIFDLQDTPIYPGSVVSLDDSPVYTGSEDTTCQLRLKGGRHTRATVKFDIPYELRALKIWPEKTTFKVLMVTPYVGIVIRATNVLRTKYRRIGLLTVATQSLDDFWDPIEKNLSPSDYPEPRSIVLV
jgi:hypothetical protein